ncbi:MAG: endonuclease [Pseudomonadota bacterium]
MSVRIASFNVENLMSRFDFAEFRRKSRQLNKSGAGGRDRHARLSKETMRVLQDLDSRAHDDDSRQLTALALASCRSDIVCLQEVEDLATLEAFEDEYLYPMTGLSYPQKVWRQGNDSRGIDVALMARSHTADGETITIDAVRSHRKLRFGDADLLTEELKEQGFEAHDRIFRRDCLEVDLRIGDGESRRRLTIFVCHFKSMGGGRNGVDGRQASRSLRVAEASAVRHIIEEKFGAERAARMRWMICGDLNDYDERLVVDGEGAGERNFRHMEDDGGALDILTRGDFAVDLVRRRPADDRWTLYHAAGPSKDARHPYDREVQHLVQLDYLLASPAFATQNGNDAAIADILRHGQPLRTPMPPSQEVARYPRTGWSRPKASDHCPVAVTLNLR